MPGSGWRRGVVVVTQATRGTTTVNKGDLVELELTSTAHRRSGSLVPWGSPVLSSAVLAKVGRPNGFTCPTGATCSFFSARQPGTTVIRVPAPSGIICHANSMDCVAVTAMLYTFTVKVAA